MKFALFYEMQTPRPYEADDWDPEAEHRTYKQALEQIELADRVGFDYVFEVEHHFLEEYSHSSCPEVFLAAASQRTKQIRLGSGIIQMPPGYNHPARTAERIATLDLVSDGRFEFGTGESTADMELEAFGIPREDKKAMWEEALRECCRMMSETPYPGYEGRYFGMPPRNVVPKPLQKPHPPIWVASTRKETTMVAARLGLGSLGFGFETPEEAEERANEYYELIREECTPISKAINPGLIVMTSWMWGPTDEEAIARSAAGPQFFSYGVAHYCGDSRLDPHDPGRLHLWRRFMDTPSYQREAIEDQRSRYRGTLGGVQLTGREAEPTNETSRALWRAARAGGLVGSSETMRSLLKRYEDAHLDVLLFNAQAGNRRHEHILESIERFAREVMPEFKERHETKHRAWRERQLDGVKFPINSSI